MLSIALSIPFTTDAMFPETWRIVTAVSTLLDTASTRLESRSRFSDSFFFRIAFAAYIRAPSAFPCCRACHMRACACAQLGGRAEVCRDRGVPSSASPSPRSHPSALSSPGGSASLR